MWNAKENFWNRESTPTSLLLFFFKLPRVPERKITSIYYSYILLAYHSMLMKEKTSINFITIINAYSFERKKQKKKADKYKKRRKTKKVALYFR